MKFNSTLITGILLLLSPTSTTIGQDLLHLNLNLLIKPDSQSFQGHAYWLLTPNGKDTLLLMLWKNHTIDSLHINSIPVNTYYRTGDSVLIPLPPTSPDTIQIDIFYTGQQATDPGGFGGIYFTSNVIYTIGVALNSIPHSFGRAWFPCIDTFTDKFTATLTIIIDTGWTVMASGSLTDTACTNNKCRWTWSINFPLPAYLLSFTAGKNYYLILDTLQDIYNNSTITAWLFTPGSKVPQTQNSFKRLDSIFIALQYWYGKHMFPRIGYSIVPFLGGAMEHPTNIAISSFLIDGTLSYENVIAHELAHHWIGDLYTIKTASDMWFQEGGPTYAERLYKEFLDGFNTASEIENLTITLLQRLHHWDNGYWIPDSLPQSTTYGNTAYDKGAYLWHALRLYINGNTGAEPFRTCLHNLVDSFAWKNAASIELTQFIERCALNQGSHWITPGTFHEWWVHRKDFPIAYIDSWEITPLSESLYRITVKVYLRRSKFPSSNHTLKIPVWLEFYSSTGTLVEKRVYLLSADSCTTITDTLSYEPAIVTINHTLPGLDANHSYLICIPPNTDTFINLASTHFSELKISAGSGYGCLYLQSVWGHPLANTDLPLSMHISPAHFWIIYWTPSITVDSLYLIYKFLPTSKDQFWAKPPSEYDLQILTRPAHTYPWTPLTSYSVLPGPYNTDGAGKILIPKPPQGHFTLAYASTAPDTLRQYNFTGCASLISYSKAELGLSSDSIFAYLDCYGILWLKAPKGKYTLKLFTADGKHLFTSQPLLLNNMQFTKINTEALSETKTSAPLFYELIEITTNEQYKEGSRKPLPRISPRRYTGILYAPECKR